MKILLITDEVWNDHIHGNNVLSNWFDGFPAEFAQIYCSPGQPSNHCCDRYFQITDKMMINSILHGTKAGKVVEQCNEVNTEYNSTDVNHIGWMRTHCGNLLRFMKSVVWTFGRYDVSGIANFIQEFQPDIIFSPRMATPKVLRLERIVRQYTSCPMFAFTGDNEYSLRMFAISPFAWVNKFWTRYQLRKNSKMYSLYYTLSDEQKAEYERVFSCPVKILRKCSRVKPDIEETPLHKPIRLVYAGKLYCNRWKTLSKIGAVLEELNGETQQFRLDIYTKDNLSNKQKDSLNYPGSVYLHGPISEDQVLRVYEKSDIALHIESFDLKYRLATRVSFSTKIIDCLSCGCAVMVVAWKEHSGLTYLKHANAAICVDDYNELLNTFSKLAENPEQLQEYKSKAITCLKKNHMRDTIQNMLYDDMKSAIRHS